MNKRLTVQLLLLLLFSLILVIANNRRMKLIQCKKIADSITTNMEFRVKQCQLANSDKCMERAAELNAKEAEFSSKIGCF